MAEFSSADYITIENKILAGRAGEVLPVLDQLLEQDPGNPALYHLKLLAAFEHCRMGELMRVTLLVQEKFPDSSVCALAEALTPGITAFQRKRRLDKAIRRGATDAYTYFLRARNAYLHGHYRAAIVDLDQCIRINLNFSKALTMRSLCYSELGDHKKALMDIFVYWMKWQQSIEPGILERIMFEFSLVVNPSLQIERPSSNPSLKPGIGYPVRAVEPDTYPESDSD